MRNLLLPAEEEYHLKISRNWLLFVSFLMLISSPHSRAATHEYTLGQEVAANFGEELTFGHLSGESDTFRERSIHGLTAHLLVGLPINLPWLGFTPGFYLEKRFTWQNQAPSLMGDRDSIGDGTFWGLGTSFRIGRWLAQGALILSGSAGLSTSSPRTSLVNATDQLSLGSPFGIRASAGYEIFQAIFAHVTYSFTHYSTIEYPQKTDPHQPDRIEQPMSPAIQEQAIAFGLSATY